MRILIAEDDDVSRLALEATLGRRGHEVVTATDGEEAWNVLRGEDAPRLAVLDWMMPRRDGIDICRLARAEPRLRGTYVILLTARTSREYVLEGLRAGADDYVCKPFDLEELEARVNVGVRVVGLQHDLAGRVRELEDALAQVKQLQGLLPMCTYCKSIRDDRDYWHRVETYIAERSAAQFTHGICPTCWEGVVLPGLRQHRGKGVEPPEQVG